MSVVNYYGEFRSEGAVKIPYTNPAVSWFIRPLFRMLARDGLLDWTITAKSGAVSGVMRGALPKLALINSEQLVNKSIVEHIPHYPRYFDKLSMTTVFDIAAYILEKSGPMTTWKLQKLVYYCQAWSLVWDGDEMFGEEIEAWANGPVCRPLYEKHKGRFRIDKLPTGNAGVLTKDQRETVDVVLRDYGGRSPQWLSDLTHMEDPWKKARRGIPRGERGNSTISKESMAEYYESLCEEDDAWLGEF